MSRNVVFGIIRVIVCMIIAGHIIWLIEREEDGHFHTTYLRGVATGVWWTIVTMSTVGYGDVYPKKPLGKAFASFVIIIGLAICMCVRLSNPALHQPFPFDIRITPMI